MVLDHILESCTAKSKETRTAKRTFTINLANLTLEAVRRTSLNPKPAVKTEIKTNTIEKTVGIGPSGETPK